jgi:uncharacterized repeat protein (TIGR01451 family)
MAKRGRRLCYALVLAALTAGGGCQGIGPKTAGDAPPARTDVGWATPPPAAVRTGAEPALATRVFRRSDGRPLANYPVRYRLLDGPPALFLPKQAHEVIVETNADGVASASLIQAAAQPGRNRVAVEVLGGPGTASPVLTRAETTVDWKAPEVSVSAAVAARVPVDQEIPWVITIHNSSVFAARAVTVRVGVPDGWKPLRTDPPAEQEGNVLVWTLAAVPARGQRALQIVYEATQAGPAAARAAVTTADGRGDEKEILCQVTPSQVARLKVEPSGPAVGVVGAPLTYRVTVTNPGTGPATNVRLRAALDGLEADGAADALVGMLAPGESRTATLAVRPKRAGAGAARVTALADNGLRDEARRPVQVQDARLTLRLSGPPACYAGGRAVWDLEAANAGDAPLSQVVVSDLLPPELEFVEASDGGRPQGREVVWQVGALRPGERKALRLTTTAARPAARATCVAAAAAPVGSGDGPATAEVRVQAEAATAVRGVPAFTMKLAGRDDTVEVGGRTAYTVTVTNRGTLPDDRVQVAATVSPLLRVLGASGPTPYRVEGGRVTFAPLAALAPGQTATYTVEVEAVRPGDARFRAELTSATLREPVVKEEVADVR